MYLNRKTLLLNILCASFVFQACAPSLPKMENAKESVLSVPNEYPEVKDNIEADVAEYQEMDKFGNGIDDDDLTPEELEARKKVDEEKKEKKEEEAVSVEKSWKNFFVDPHLNSLIDTALKNNQELNILVQEVNVAQNEIMSREGEYLPKVGLGGGIELEKVGEYTSQGASDKTTEYETGKRVPEKLVNRSLGLYATWELDIWKKLRNAAKSAFYRYLSTVEGRKFMVTKLVTEISSSYYELMALDQQLEIVNSYIKILKQAQNLVELQQQAAKVTSLAVKRFAAEVLKNQSRQYELQQQIIMTENKINVLVGRFPQPVERTSKDFTSLVSKAIESGVPSKLLDNRPDVKRASLDLEASKLDVKVARARFYPSLSIEANAGYEAFKSNHLFKSPESVFYNLAANLTAPLLNRQAIKADYYSANSKQIQALYNYEQTIINAYTEVANQLSMIKNLEKIYKLKQRQVQALTASVNISGVLFKAARVNYVEALMTQRDSLEAQVDLVEIKKEQLVSYVKLYKALGGGWRE